MNVLDKNNNILHIIDFQGKFLKFLMKSVVMEFAVNADTKCYYLPRTLCQEIFHRKFAGSKGRLHSMVTSLYIGVYTTNVRGKWVASYPETLIGDAANLLQFLVKYF